MKAADLYDTDFAEWARYNAELLRTGRISEADLEHLAEEVEDLSNRKRDELESRLTRLLQHLLKWQDQPLKRGTSWRATIFEQRYRIQRLLKQNPSLRREVAALLDEAYPLAVKRASFETGYPEGVWPPKCPWEPDRLLDENFWPEEPPPTR